MKVKSFNTYLEKRLDKKEIKEIKDAAKVEFEIFTALQEEVAKTLVDFMTKNSLGFNELVAKLGKSPTQVSKIIKGKANLTLATIAQLYAFMGRRPHIIARELD